MFFRRYVIAALGVVLVTASGCGPKAVKRACMGVGPDNPLVADAAMVRLDVYGPNAHCADSSTLTAGSGTPILSRSYAQGQAITLDVPPGPHALVLSTFADADGMQLLGVGCTEADLAAGSQICFDLTIEPAPDGGDDLSGAVCSTNPDDCPTGQYCNGLLCVPGCKADSDCPKSDAGLGACDTTTHTCDDCVVDANCGNTPGAACCNKHCTNTKTDPLNCNGCGLACTGGATSCCNGACSNPSTDANNCGGCGNACSTVNASSVSCAGAMCGWTCTSGFAHCKMGNTGCDTNLAGAGDKLCGSVCVPSGSCCSSADCMSPPAPTACYMPAGACSGVGGTCSYTLKTGSKVCGAVCCNAILGTCNADCSLTCKSGYADCDGDPSNGCETDLTATGKKVCNGACIAATSCCNNNDCTMPPVPQACYGMTGSCPAPGGTCQYTENTGSQICNGTVCCNAINGTCNASCGLSCASGFLDCNSTPSDGCETSCAPANGTGACVSGACGIGSCNNGWLDCDGSASDGCECNTSCCVNPMTSKQDCMVDTHRDGYGHTFAACYPLGVPGTWTSSTSFTPGTGYSATVGTDAANADTTQAGTISTGLWCGAKNGAQVISACKQNGNTDCTCWAYAATAGNCNDPQDNVSKPCTSFIGHTFHLTGNTCPCISVTDPTYQ